MERIQTYFRKNSEQVFALAIMWSVVGVIYFLPYKLTFLLINCRLPNFYRQEEDR